jgi:hypothetical protein
MRASVKAMTDRLAGATVARGRLGISFELRSAWELAPVAGEPDLGEAERRVFRWLVRHRDHLVAAEDRWDVDRRAIAGAIAWEALGNTNYFTPVLKGCGRASGPGKVHYRSQVLCREGNPVAKQVEVAGYLPRRSAAERRELLRRPDAAIGYIGAIMCAYADIGARHGFVDLRYRADLILTQPYNGVRLVDGLDELGSWRATVARRERDGTALVPLNPMYHWVNVPANRAFLDAAVGCRRAPGAGTGGRGGRLAHADQQAGAERARPHRGQVGEGDQRRLVADLLVDEGAAAAQDA